MRTKRASGFRSVFFHRSTWAVSPVSLPPAVCCSDGDHRPVRRPEIREAVTSTISLCNGLPQPLTRLFAVIPNRVGDHLPALSAESNPNPGVVGFLNTNEPSVRPAPVSWT